MVNQLNTTMADQNPTLQTDVELLKKDVEQISEFLKRLDVAIEKLSEVSTGISKIIAVHDKRMETVEQTDKQLFEIIDVERTKNESERGRLYKRIDEVERQVNDRITDHQHDVLTKLGDIEVQNSQIFQKLETRVHSLDKWRWLMIGGGAVAGFLANYILEIIQVLFPS